MFARLEEQLYLPLRASWVAKHGMSEKEQEILTRSLLHEIDSLPALHSSTAIILGATRATAVVVGEALKRGHKDFILVGQKPIGQEHPFLTRYVMAHMNNVQKQAAHDGTQTETALARKLLLQAGIEADRIHTLENDDSMNTGANMRVLKNSRFGNLPEMEFYTLSGFARRAWMAARKELGENPLIRVHNSYPDKVTQANWFQDLTACAFMTSEGIKCLNANPLYVRLGYCVSLDLAKEEQRLSFRIRQKRVSTCTLKILTSDHP